MKVICSGWPDFARGLKLSKTNTLDKRVFFFFLAAKLNGYERQSNQKRYELWL